MLFPDMFPKSQLKLFTRVSVQLSFYFKGVNGHGLTQVTIYDNSDGGDEEHAGSRAGCALCCNEDMFALYVD